MANVPDEPTTHEEFARTWSPARNALDHQTAKVNGHRPISEEER